MGAVLTILRDPVWTFITVLVAALTLITTWRVSSPKKKKLRNSAIALLVIIIVYTIAILVINVNTIPATSLVVSGNAQDGVPFTVSESGTYQVTITDGAYNTNSCNDLGHWRTVLRIYIDKAVEWGKLQANGNIEPAHFDDSIGAGGFSNTQQDAVIEAKKPENSTRTFSLQKGDRIIFIPADIQNGYGDNCGNVDLSITLTQSQ